MAVSDNTVFILMAVLINYLIVYNKNRLVGNVLFMIIGLGIWSQLISANAWIGVVLFFMGMVSTLYDLIAGGKQRK